jgi:hypothetical protein
MPTFTYRCPQLGLNVQGFVVGKRARVLLKCLACAEVHLVNPIGAKVAGLEDDEAYHE